MELTQADRMIAENRELREMLAYVSGLLADLRDGVPPRAEGLWRVCARAMVDQVRRAGIKPKRIWGGQ